MITAAILIIKIYSFYTTQSKISKPSGQQSLPEDVELKVEGYSFNEKYDGVEVRIDGKRIIRRGRRVLGLRSNLVKTNFFEEIKGSLRSGKGVFTFSAKNGEWEADGSRPFVLRGDVAVTVNGKPIENVENARIFFKQGRLEVNNNMQKVYYFK